VIMLRNEWEGGREGVETADNPFSCQDKRTGRRCSIQDLNSSRILVE
jgi:hypothetical protein